MNLGINLAREIQVALVIFELVSFDRLDPVLDQLCPGVLVLRSVKHQFIKDIFDLLN
jgi:hypothetical protein